MVLGAAPPLVDDELRLELERIRIAADELVRPLEMPDDVWRVGGAAFGAVRQVSGEPSALPAAPAGGAVPGSRGTRPGRPARARGRRAVAAVAGPRRTPGERPANAARLSELLAPIR
jgi:hypothetical protein